MLINFADYEWKQDFMHVVNYKLGPRAALKFT